MNRFIAGAIVGMCVVSLSSCSNLDGEAKANKWTKDEIGGVVSLSSLGELSTQDGKFMAGDKVVDATLIVSGQTADRNYNLLYLSDEVLNKLPIAQRDALLFMTQAELNAGLKKYGITSSEIRLLQVDGSISLTEFKSLANKAALNTKNPALLDSLNLSGK